MDTVQLDHNLPAITFEATDPNLTNFAQLLGKFIVVYFYPKDNTPACSLEGQDFRDSYAEFTKMNTEIIGVSRDNLACHGKFISKFTLPFPLIADINEVVCQAFGIIGAKTFFSRTIFGVKRTTFLIDDHGIVRHIWRNVKAKGHVAQVLTKVQQLTSPVV